MKKKILFVVCFFATMMLQAAVYKTVNISAGGLSTALTATEKASVTNLTVTGKIDARDIKLMRDSITNLSVINISAAIIQAYTGTAGTVSVSTSYLANKMPKNSFCKTDYSGKTTISSIVLPTTLTSIGSYAFANCIGITSITIPATITSIEDYAFFGCSGLLSLTIPNSVSTIGSYAFCSCASLSSLTISNAITSIKEWTFGNCPSLTSVTIPSSVSSIGDYAFFGCSKLSGINIPSVVKSIGEGAFDSCSGLTSITIPGSVVSIKTGTFSNCTGLTSVIIPNEVDSIGDWAFSNCTKLSGVNIPSSVSSVGSGAFYGCTSISSIDIPNSVTSIGEDAFGNCTGITRLTIPNSVTLIDNGTFSNCNGLKTVTIPESVKSIGAWAFYSCKGLTSLTIGDSITTIGEYAFSDCTALTSIYANATTPIALTTSVMTSVNRSTCTLYVPTGSKSLYQAAAIWKEFTNIMETQTIFTQEIPLISGWNIISSNVIPSSTNLKNILQPLIDGGKLVKVMDESGKAIENFATYGGWNNGIGNFSQTEGYKVFMTSADILTLEGKAIQLPLNIALSAGWNIISYPCVNAQSALTMVQPLINAGTLKKVMDESGNSIEDFGTYGGWKNSIGNFIPGKGFKIYMSQPDTLSMTSTLLRSASATALPAVSEPTYFTKVYEGNGNDHMNINLVNLSSSTFQANDEIGVFDGEVCVGAIIISADQIAEGIISIPTSCNDSQADTVNGFTPGNAVKIKLYSKGSFYNLTTEKISGTDTYVKNGSLFAEVLSKVLTENVPTDISKEKETIQIACYPNPFVEEVSIDVQNTELKALTVVIYNLLGQKIKELYKGDADALHLKWNGTDEKGNQVISGVYLCKVNGSSKKIVLIGR